MPRSGVAPHRTSEHRKTYILHAKTTSLQDDGICFIEFGLWLAYVVTSATLVAKIAWTMLWWAAFYSGRTALVDKK